MFVQSFAILFFFLSFVSPFVATHPVERKDLEERAGCTFAMKKAAIQHEIDTISSHSFSDANQIPLAPTASRTFYVTPSELGITLPPINVGVTAGTVRSELVSLATVLDASVPGNRAAYIQNADGSVTSNFIQNDRIVLPHEQVSEVHQFNSACQITKITGTVHGPVVRPGGKSTVSNPVLIALCAAVAAADIL